MSTRSPYNDRNKVEQKGKTRKSAAASKPKREAGAPASATPAKKKAPAKKTPRWGLGPARTASPQIPQSPAMKKLRRLWWVLWGSSLVIALIAVFVGNAAKTNHSLDTVYSILLGVWAASFAGVIYLEFGPLRKARMAAIEEAKHSKGKKSKAARPDVSNDAKKGAAAGKEVTRDEDSGTDGDA